MWGVFILGYDKIDPYKTEKYWIFQDKFCTCMGARIMKWSFKPPYNLVPYAIFYLMVTQNSACVALIISS